jgi:Ca2+-dependent lipid-binding protein
LADTSKQDHSKNYVLLKVISASQLMGVNSSGSSDPYCRIYWQGERLFRTRELFNTLNPVWNESFIIGLPRDDISTLDLRIEV